MNRVRQSGGAARVGERAFRSLPRCCVRRAVGVFALLLAVVSAAGLRGQPEPQMLLEEGLYRLGMQGDTAGALALMERVWLSPDASTDMAAEALLCAISIHLDAGREPEARALYRRLAELSGRGSPWLERARRVVPPGFLVRSDPWQDGERWLYRWTNAEGATVGHALVRIDHLDQDGDARWRISTVTFAGGYGYHWMEFDDGLAHLLRAGYRHRAAEPMETTGPAVTGDGAGMQLFPIYPGDVDSVGQMLRKVNIRPGQVLQSELYRPAEGSVVPATIEWRSIEFTGQSGDEPGLLELEVICGGQQATFWLRQDRSHSLLRHSCQGITGQLVDSWTTGGGPGYRTTPLGQGLVLDCPDDWCVVRDAGNDAETARRVQLLTDEGGFSFWIELDPQTPVPPAADPEPGEQPLQTRDGAMTGRTWTVTTGERAIIRAELAGQGIALVATAWGPSDVIDDHLVRVEQVLTSIRMGEGTR